jgi:peptidoglycan/xylan/chitin deacetylase (PgdA/CDA1 family)
MLTSRNITIAFVAGLVVFFWFHASIPIYIVWGILCSLPLGWGSYRIDSNVYLPVLCSGPTEKKQIAITFDDGPSADFTPQILDILQTKKVEAAFFCIGNRIAGHEALLNRMHQNGHIIGNHSFSHHFWFDLFSTKRMRADLAKMDEALHTATGLKPRLFRPPYGVTNPNLARAIRRGKYIPIGWNIRSLDTVNKNPEDLLARVGRALRPGAIVLFHDTSASTLAILGEFIDKARDSGYSISRLDKMCNLIPYA